MPAIKKINIAGRPIKTIDGAIRNIALPIKIFGPPSAFFRGDIRTIDNIETIKCHKQ